ncbi:MAG: DNA topoisomerase [Candidatus Hodarchaeales archaeon]|jgi:DNA topoisomerase-1
MSSQRKRKNVLVVGEKASQVRTFCDTLLSAVSTKKVGKRVYIRTGQWKGNTLTFLPLSGHITTLDTKKGYGWGEVPPITLVQDPKALIVKENYEFRKIIRDLAKSTDELWLATDPDSEGDNIALEAYNIAIRSNSKLKTTTRRIWNSSLTSDEILRAFNQLTPWSIYQALAVQGRRTVDAWVGFAGTREVTQAARKVRNERGLVMSVGRVQLPTLKLIVDRDNERAAFVAQEKYNLLADLLDSSRQEVLVSVQHDRSPFTKEEDVQKILTKLQKSTLGKITSFQRRQTQIPPPRPMNTTDAIALLSRSLKVKADEALAILATLYEQGYISYPRTENRKFKDNFPHKDILLKLQTHAPYKVFFQQIKSMNQVRTNGRKQGTEDHDPIHPTGEIPQIGGKITPIHLKSWTFIARWYVGMFMEDLIQQRGVVKLNIKEEPFSQKYQTTHSFGWTEAITWRKPRETPSFNFEKGQIVQVRNIRSEIFNTKPPARWGDAALIKRLEKLKIGTKSSRPDVIKKLELRRYIKREGTSYESTSTGKTLIKVFDSIWPDLVTPKFTRQVEIRMDEVATEKCSYENMLETIRNEYIALHEQLLSQILVLQDQLKQAFANLGTSSRKKSGSQRSKSSQKLISSKSSYPCPVCTVGNLRERTNSRTGEKFYGCSRYPACTFTSPSVKLKGQKFGPAVYKK